MSEYDIRLDRESADPKTADGVSIVLWIEELLPDKWPGAVADNLNEVINLDPRTEQRAISLQTEWTWDKEIGEFKRDWGFLDAKGERKIGRSASSTSLRQLCSYLPVFYLGALRDAGDEYSPRSSQFWTRLLKDLKIPSDTEESVVQTLKELNARLLGADPRLDQIKGTVSGAARVSAGNQGGSLDLRMAPVKVWDLLSKAEVILRNDADSAWLPLLQQGQGIQSLSVLFLFQAFVDHLLRELYQPDSVPVLALEEPETHLHPQAVRTLWQHVRDLPGQKLITNHSPYFVQNVPFRDLRFIRLTESGTKVRSLPASCSATIPQALGLDDIVERSSGLLHYDATLEKLTVAGSMDENTFRKLLICFKDHADKDALGRDLRDLRDRSSQIVSDEDLKSLETSARRMRGEILFARKWLIVEGPSDFLVIHAVAGALGYSLDENSIAVIDAQNNGNPALFAVLARALSIPWCAVFDGDDGGRNFRKGILRRGFSEDEIEKRCWLHREGTLECVLATGGLREELIDVLPNLGVESNHEQLVTNLKKEKMVYATALSKRLGDNPDLVERAPKAFREAVTWLRGSA
ncbi:MAG: DUF2813 domain-containing protein [Bacteroidota bacterium]|nr:DUF2813 domain-containing protein [Bacteroidota bacterium]